MLVDELSLWKCIHCETQNDHTNWKCWNCGKKKNKLSTVKKILKKRAKEQQAKKEAQKQQNIERLENPPIESASDLTFDLDKLQDN